MASSRSVGTRRRWRSALTARRCSWPTARGWALDPMCRLGKPIPGTFTNRRRSITSAGRWTALCPSSLGRTRRKWRPIRNKSGAIRHTRRRPCGGGAGGARGRLAGNGDTNLVMFGEDVAPNHHRLAREYVLLDNLYCNGEVSVDGHSWCDAAIATDYNERSWIQSYSRHGTLPGNREMGVPSAGFLWDQCRRAGLSYRSYGEASFLIPSQNRGRWRGGRDMNRVDDWVADLHEAEKTGSLQAFMVMSLGEDHTSGTTPGRPTPDAAVGSNDVALGKIVAAASRSRFWKQMAIFVIEDDAQNGPDHVDAHRTCGLVISPWCKRG